VSIHNWAHKQPTQETITQQSKQQSRDFIKFDYTQKVFAGPHFCITELLLKQGYKSWGVTLDEAPYKLSGAVAS
jgi:hypothetical protein